MVKFQGLPLLIAMSLGAGPVGAVVPPRRNQQKFRRIEAAIQRIADAFITKVNAEIGVALRGKRTPDEMERLRTIQQECGRLQRETLQLLITLHGLNKPGDQPAQHP